MSLRKTTRSPQTPFCGKRGAVGEKHILAFRQDKFKEMTLAMTETPPIFRKTAFDAVERARGLIFDCEGRWWRRFPSMDEPGLMACAARGKNSARMVLSTGWNVRIYADRRI
jgi:hypothetical protein